MGLFFGSFIFGYLGDKIGRKKTLGPSTNDVTIFKGGVGKVILIMYDSKKVVMSGRVKSGDVGMGEGLKYQKIIDDIIYGRPPSDCHFDFLRRKSDWSFLWFKLCCLFNHSICDCGW